MYKYKKHYHLLYGMLSTVNCIQILDMLNKNVCNSGATKCDTSLMPAPTEFPVIQFLY